ncbi:twin-arginine translocase subunit TatC [Thermoflavifilum thermophilum]|nr:twin-arginine translocase subunit TatC [Thermoflavifilum thermophilum]
MSFFDHLEELRWHIIRSLIAVLIAATLVFIFIHQIYNDIIMGPTHPEFITYRILCQIDRALHLGNKLCLQSLDIHFQNLEVSGQFMLSLTSSVVMGVIVSVPYILWEFWRFIKPALTPQEIRYARGIVFWTSLLFFLGVSFGYFLIAPYALTFFANYKISNQFENIFTVQSYLSMLSQLVIGLGCIFELPILVYFLTKIGLVTPRFLKTYRRHAILVIVILAAFIAPPDITSQLIIAFPLYLLYELSITISARVLKQEKEKAVEEWS